MPRSLPDNQTLRQIAQDLNLSLMSVSRAVHDRKGVSEQTRQRVKDYARQINYRPNLAARALVQRKTQVLGVIFPSLRQTFWADIVLGIEHAAKAAGYTVLLAHSNDRPEIERDEIDTLLARQVDALLVASSDPDANADILGQVLASSRPLVLFDRSARDLDASGVYCDDRDGARRATNHLIGLGYRNITHLAGPPALSVARDRLAGYQDAMAAAGLPEFTLPCGFGEEAGRQGMRALLEHGALPEAIFAAHDPVVFGVLDVLKERGIRVPHDIALVGYTDVEHARHLAVPLTVMAQPTFEMGQATAKLALDLLAGAAPPGTRHILPASLIVRESCGAHLRGAAGK
jgi:DNA-binding LacI/PurR family transcriptional regulator